MRRIQRKRSSQRFNSKNSISKTEKRMRIEVSLNIVIKILNYVVRSQVLEREKMMIYTFQLVILLQVIKHVLTIFKLILFYF